MLKDTTYIQGHKRNTTVKMADEVNEGIENALNLVVLTIERSGNMKKDLKQTIFETVSTLRNLFVKMKNNCEVNSSKISELKAKVAKAKTELQRFTDKGRHLLYQVRNEQGRGYMGRHLLHQGTKQPD
jgi:expansin (peptidoglycan-binding protein)